MLTYTDLTKGTIFILDGEPYEVLEYSFLRMQQRKPVTKTKIRNLINGAVVERNFHQNETFEEAEIEKENLIRGIALGRLRSTNFIVEGYGKKSGLPKYFIFWGAGWGHAVGLCQSGAAGMAEKKHTYSDILKKYYKDTYIKKIDY